MANCYQTVISSKQSLIQQRDAEAKIHIKLVSTVIVVTGCTSAASQIDPSYSTDDVHPHVIENGSVLIQLAQCWFPGLAISNAKI